MKQKQPVDGCTLQSTDNEISQHCFKEIEDEILFFFDGELNTFGLWTKQDLGGILMFFHLFLQFSNQQWINLMIK